MPLVFPVRREILLRTYSNVKELLCSVQSEKVIIDSMVVVSARQNYNFSPPSSKSQHQNKLREVDRILKRIAITRGEDFVIELLEEVWKNVKNGNGLPGVSNQDLLENIEFPFLEDSKVYLTDDLKWVVAWEILPSNEVGKQEITLTLQDSQLGVVIPPYVFEYLNTAIIAFKKQMFSVCLALNSIVMEATIKDVLFTKGYTFDYSDRKKPNYIGGLGAGLDRARNKENFLTSGVLPEDLDKVIKTVRNNLIHLSGDVFQTPLPQFNRIRQNFKLEDFVASPHMVFDLLDSVIHCAEALYTELRTNGHKYSP